MICSFINIISFKILKFTLTLKLNEVGKCLSIVVSFRSIL